MQSRTRDAGGLSALRGIRALVLAVIAMTGARTTTSLGLDLMSGQSGQSVSAVVMPAAAATSLTSWTPIARPEPDFDSHVAARLPDGRVLIAGGQSSRSAQVFDPFVEEWEATAPMNEVRADAVAVPLEDGDVLVIGGTRACDSSVAGDCVPGHGGFHSIDTAERYDVDTGTWSFTANRLSVGRGRLHAAARLGDGRVIVAGGVYGYDQRLSAVDVYDPESNSWTLGPALPNGARVYAQAAPLATGDVILVGGFGYGGTYSDSLLFDHAEDRWITADQDPRLQLPAPRWGHGMVLLSTGDLLLAGGGTTGGLLPSETFLFNPATGWGIGAALAQPRTVPVMAALDDDSVLIAAGCAVHYDPRVSCIGHPGDIVEETERWTEAEGWQWAGGLSSPRLRSTLTPLPGNSALSVGGRDAVNHAALQSVERFGRTCTGPGDLAAWWPMDAAAGRLLIDQTGRGRDATLTDDAAIWHPLGGKVGGALEFVGSVPSYAVVQDSPQIDIGTGDVSFDFWVLLPVDAQGAYPAGSGLLLRKRPVTVGAGYQIQIRNGRYEVDLGIPGAKSHFYTANQTVVAGSWQHVAIVVDRTGTDAGVRFYVNGLLEATGGDNDLLQGIYPAWDLSNSSPLTIGGDGSTAFLGTLDDLRIHRRALGPDFLQAIHQAGATGICGVETILIDEDADGVESALDNCPAQWNPDQADADGDRRGDACDLDDDGDGLPDDMDSCPLEAPESIDVDADGCQDDIDDYAGVLDRLELSYHGPQQIFYRRLSQAIYSWNQYQVHPEQEWRVNLARRFLDDVHELAERYESTDLVSSEQAAALHAFADHVLGMLP